MNRYIEYGMLLVVFISKYDRKNKKLMYSQGLVAYFKQVKTKLSRTAL